jgi:hypothetical protein
MYTVGISPYARDRLCYVLISEIQFTRTSRPFASDSEPHGFTIALLCDDTLSSDCPSE